ncbi:MAG: TIGR02281 family clan AA aspartic protease [Proteobacteria bacterium]|nr:TIGR02281 family clan AA aspartic protease [Pseudomonadota bacterium]
MKKPVFIAGVTVALTALGLWGLSRAFPGALDAADDRARLASNLVWLVVLGAAVAVHVRTNPGHALRAAAVWVAIGAALVLAYSFRHDAADVVARVRAELVPGAGVPGEGGTVSYRLSKGGHFVVQADVDGTRIQFLVDTGATGVVLSAADARRLGFDLDALRYTQPAQTANGVVLGAPVRLRQMRLGSIVVNDISATVNGGEMTGSLLGMEVLRRLGGYEVRDDVLTIRPPAP